MFNKFIQFKSSKNVFRKIVICKSLLLLIFASAANKTFAWIYPEHRDIALLAIKRLTPEYRSILDKMWSAARTGHTERLTEFIIDTAQSTKPRQLDYASWAGISGDHSCSPENLLYNVLQTDWILKVADITAQLKIDLSKAKSRSQYINAIRDSDIKLQRADLEYATRAGSNNVHFLLARPGVNTRALEYLISCIEKGKALNAIGAYALFHMTALEKATRYANSNLAAPEKTALALAALADEAFALHFLEDSYSAGHIAGTWGKAPVRKGTHDYYGEKGLEVVCWDGTRMIMMGDGYMKDSDAGIAAESIRLSLQQLLDAANGQLQSHFQQANISRVTVPDSFNVCRNNFIPDFYFDSVLLKVILSKTPVPGLATGFGELPRFRSEFGTFIGVSSSLNGETISGGFGKQQTRSGVSGGLEANIRLGLGLDGVLNEAGDGLVFLQFGWRQDAASSNQFFNKDPSFPSNSITSAIPGRAGYTARLRLPFWLVPGDLLVAGPLLLLTSPKTLTNMAVAAANGGLIPWQSGIHTGFGKFQFILGREVGITFYGLGKRDDVILIPVSETKATLLKYKSTKLDFPIVEYSPMRSFAQDQSSSIIIQINAGVDIPHSATVMLPSGAILPELEPVWQIGLHIVFNWRNYF